MKKCNKYIVAGAVALTLGMGASSCINDLDVTPPDPSTLTWADVESDPDLYLPQMFNKCYASFTMSGSKGEGDSDIKGADAGKSNWHRTMFMLNEKTTDECMWIYTEDGVENLVRGTWNNGLGLIYGLYSRLYTNIAICNDFLRQTETTGINLSDANRTDYNCTEQYQYEVRALRALAYWNVLDVFGNGGWVDETVPYGTNAEPIKRADLYEKLVAELKDIIDTWPAATRNTVLYGRVGLDGVKMLLAKVYLNAEVYTDGAKKEYDECARILKEIAASHQGGGFQGSGLANNYLALFSADNDRYMPGGSATSENEILWGFPYESTNTQAYGGTRYMIAAQLSNGTAESLADVDIAASKYYMFAADYGQTDQWGCLHAREQFSDKFIDANDVRDNLWAKEAEGFQKENTSYSTYNNGYIPVKFTNLRTNADGTFDLVDPSKGISIHNMAASAKSLNTNVRPDTDLPVFRLADVYLMLAECQLRGATNVTVSEALTYVNYVRERAGATKWTTLNLDNLLDERARELYWELSRRSDLVRFDKFVSGYNWSWKGGVYEGTDLNPNFNVFPIPANAISAQPELGAVQNTGY